MSANNELTPSEIAAAVRGVKWFSRFIVDRMVVPGVVFNDVDDIRARLAVLSELVNLYDDLLDEVEWLERCPSNAELGRLIAELEED